MHVEWDIEDDSKLLRGIYQYGMGNWKAIKSDPSLGLENIILRSENENYDSKALRRRTLYLLMILRNKMSSNRAKVSVSLGSFSLSFV